ncbi:Nuclease-related domain-containing protein [Psychrobacillus sp. OK028]|uniref:nuclease-related domain-containing protein n=1 Tax=Psychrobacillus sp. OK028 TaxID=1884359 RepID=UPI000881F7BE|nr:nuclease-related domain-containing protein [Psychrobacillus sp. OK028]SDN99750.1 Nuclease-related domain-containing protein [Psychrobacillus sp. OK028]
MIIKPYSNSVHLEAMELLAKRLPLMHPFYNKLLIEIQTTRAGDYGEKIVFKELEKLQLPFKCFVFHKVMLRTEKTFEMDVLLITPYGAVILEIKNITGKLEFKENPSQLIQTRDSGEVNNYPCPVTQLTEYKYLLSKFLSAHNFSIPVNGAIVFATRKSFVETSSSKASILYTNEIHSYLRNLQDHTPVLTNSQIDLLKKLILKKNSPFSYFPLTKHFYIDASDVIRGVACPNCGQIGMQKIQKKWYCPQCYLKDSKAHIESLRTYFLLCNNYITNKTCREFLLLNSRYEAKRILINSSLIKIGDKKSTKYIMKSSIPREYSP